MNKWWILLWKLTRWIPGAFSLSSRIYERRFPKFEAMQSRFPEEFSDFRVCILVPDELLNVPSFTPGSGNLFFEIFQSAKERYGDSEVFAFGTSALDNNLTEFLDFLEQRKITHIVMSPESPELPEEFALPAIINQICGSKSVTFWFFLLDSVHWDHMFKLNHISRFIGDFVALGIDKPLNSRLKRKSASAMQQCLPISKKTISLLPAYPKKVHETQDITFIGGIYKYRKKILESIPQAVVSINPHRPNGEAADYIDYMQALRDSRLTINFARASSYPEPQLKSRVLEAGVMGCPVISDDKGLAASFLGDEKMVLTVSKLGSMRSALMSPSVMQRASLVDRDKLQEISREKAPSAFWESFEQVDRHFSSKRK